jgi:hypothetical protein
MSKSLLQSQINLFEAVEVAPDRYAYEGDDGWRVATSEAFIRCAIDDEYGLDAHSVEMPAWWTPEPECRTIMRLQGDDYVLMTADLETGAEVPRGMTYGKANDGRVRRDRQAKARIERCISTFPYSRLNIQCESSPGHGGDCIAAFINLEPHTRSTFTWPMRVGADAAVSL